MNALAATEVVETVAQVREALARNAALQNHPDALHYAGAPYLREMLREAGFDETRHRFVLQGEDAALLIGALRERFTAVRYTGPVGMRKKLREIVLASGAEWVE